MKSTRSFLRLSPTFSAASVSAYRLSLLGVTASTIFWASSAYTDEPGIDHSAIPIIKVNGMAEGSGSYTLTEITVGGKSPIPLVEMPHSVSVITRKRIEDQNLNSAEEALSQVTGVTVTAWNGATSQIRSRGYFMESSYDGIPEYDGLNASQQYDLAMFDRVEILRGPSGLFQGSGQPGGTVNFVRKRAPSLAQGSLALTYGSYSFKRAELDAGAPLAANGALRGRLSAATQRNDFYYENADSEKNFVYGALDYDLTPATTVAFYAAFQDNKTSPFSGLPSYTDGRLIDAPRSTNPTPAWATHDTRNTTLGLEGIHYLNGGWELNARVRYSESSWYLNDAYPSSGVDPMTGLISSYTRRGWDDDTERTSFDLYANGPFSLLGRQHQATVGYNYGSYNGKTLYGAYTSTKEIPFGQPSLVPENSVQPYARGWEYKTRQDGLYSQLRLSLTDPLTLVLGGRLSDFENSGRYVSPSPLTDWEDSGSESGVFTPYAGLVYRINQTLSVYTSYSDIFIPQSQKELSGATLAPREGQQYEAGFKGQLNNGRLQFSASVFQMQDINRAYRDQANPGFFFAAGKVKVEGAEIDISGSPVANLQLTAGYAYLDSQYEVDLNRPGQQFSLFEPRHSLKLYGTYRFASTPWRISSGMTANSAIDGTGEQGVREGSGYVVFNAQLGYDISSNTSVTLAANNLTDRRYYARIGGLNSYNTYGEPRSLSLNVRANF